MKILLVADLHLNSCWFDWVVNEADRFDLVAIAGDVLNAFSDRRLLDQVNDVTKWLMHLKCPLVICSGNHDYWSKSPRVIEEDQNAEAAWIKRLKGRGQIIGIDGDVVNFQPKFSDDAPTRIVVNGWLQTPELDGEVDIVVTHSPPSSCYCSIGDEGYDVGDTDLWPALQYHPPKLILSGHVHRPYKFISSWPQVESQSLILVPGVSGNGKTPAHWNIDTGLGRAVHSSGVGATFRWDS
ncbi:MAG: metallophosphoesterase [Opitutaceae bacterium]|nr:metallophosphoesterase [Opitutaceae bacterium]